MKLAVDAIKEDPTLQLREGLDMDRVQAMIEFEEQGGQLPPVTVVGPDNILGDGHHRLYAAMTSGKLEVDANRIGGGLAEAVVVAITGNDSAAAKPLTRTERNKGIKLLLAAGWTQQAIADATGLAQPTIIGIYNVLAMRGHLPRAPKVAGKGGRTPKPIARIPDVTADRLHDTTLDRISSVPAPQQVELAEAVVKHKLPEPRVREAVKLVKGGMNPTDAVDAVRSHAEPMPKNMHQIGVAVQKRFADFTDAQMVIDKKSYGLWQVLDVLAAQGVSDPMARGLSKVMADLSVRLDRYATLFAADESEALLVEA